jgi:hypothetical protein
MVDGQNLAVFTACSNNYLPMAKVLFESLRRYIPEATLYLCLADQRLPSDELYPEGVNIIQADQLDIPQFRHFAFRYDILEFNTALKPFMFLELIARGHKGVLYFDPDIELYSRLDDILAELNGDTSFVLTPHVLSPNKDIEADLTIMRAGVYNLGFLGVGWGSGTIEVLKWWASRLIYNCVVDIEKGIFVDQKYFDMVPGFLPNVSILQSARHNVAYWNLSGRSLEMQNDAWIVDGKELGFFHFSGFDCSNLNRLSKFTERFRDEKISRALKKLMESYAGKVYGHGLDKAKAIPYAFGNFVSGRTIPREARVAFRERAFTHDIDDPFEEFENCPVDAEAVLLSAMSKSQLLRYVHSIHGSTSWRVTKPMRAVARLLRTLKPNYDGIAINESAVKRRNK